MNQRSLQYWLRRAVASDKDLIRESRNFETNRIVSTTTSKITQSQHDSWFQSVMNGVEWSVFVLEGPRSPLFYFTVQHLAEHSVVGAIRCKEAAFLPLVGALVPLLALEVGFFDRDTTSLRMEVMRTNSVILRSRRALGLDTLGQIQDLGRSIIQTVSRTQFEEARIRLWKEAQTKFGASVTIFFDLFC